MDEFINVSHSFINGSSRYITTFCDLEIKKNKKLFILVFLILPFSWTRPRLKNRRLL